MTWPIFRQIKNHCASPVFRSCIWWSVDRPVVLLYVFCLFNYHIHIMIVGGRHLWLFVFAGGPPYVLCTYLIYHVYTLFIYTSIYILGGPPAMSKSRPPTTMMYIPYISYMNSMYIYNCKHIQLAARHQLWWSTLTLALPSASSEFKLSWTNPRANIPGIACDLPSVYVLQSSNLSFRTTFIRNSDLFEFNLIY